MNFILFSIVLTFSFVNAAPLDDGSDAGVRIDDMKFLSDPFKATRNANMNSRKWENGVIPYAFDPASPYTQAEKDTIIKSMKTIEEKTGSCLKFRARTSESDYVKFTAGSGCWSWVGRSGGDQVISIDRNGCVHHGVVMHELLHASGFEHEQCRNDRDDYVLVIKSNIQSGMEHNFNKMPATVVNSFGMDYDYSSIMHYGWSSFSSNGRATIIPRLPSVDMYSLGQRSDLSASDIKKVKLFYGCPA